jgi:hypothetical protein
MYSSTYIYFNEIKMNQCTPLGTLSSGDRTTDQIQVITVLEGVV